MNNKTLTRADLSANVYREIGISLSEATAIVDAVIDEVIEALAEGETVKLSSFGTFSLRRKKTTHRAQSKNRRRSAYHSADGIVVQCIQYIEKRRK